MNDSSFWYTTGSHQGQGSLVYHLSFQIPDWSKSWSAVCGTKNFLQTGWTCLWEAPHKVLSRCKFPFFNRFNRNTSLLGLLQQETPDFKYFPIPLKLTFSRPNFILSEYKIFLQVSTSHNAQSLQVVQSFTKQTLTHTFSLISKNVQPELHVTTPCKNHKEIFSGLPPNFSQTRSLAKFCRLVEYWKPQSVWVQNNNLPPKHQKSLVLTMDRDATILLHFSFKYKIYIAVTSNWWPQYML